MTINRAAVPGLLPRDRPRRGQLAPHPSSGRRRLPGWSGADGHPPDHRVAGRAPGRDGPGAGQVARRPIPGWRPAPARAARQRRRGRRLTAGGRCRPAACCRAAQPGGLLLRFRSRHRLRRRRGPPGVLDLLQGKDRGQRACRRRSRVHGGPLRPAVGARPGADESLRGSGSSTSSRTALLRMSMDSGLDAWPWLGPCPLANTRSRGLRCTR
jgi:hypothetical protein